MRGGHHESQGQPPAFHREADRGRGHHLPRNEGADAMRLQNPGQLHGGLRSEPPRVMADDDCIAPARQGDSAVRLPRIPVAALLVGEDVPFDYRRGLLGMKERRRQHLERHPVVRVDRAQKRDVHADPRPGMRRQPVLANLPVAGS